MTGCIVEPWDPPVYARRLRHQCNNLLVPVMVATELLDEESDAADLLAKSAARLRRSMNRLGELVALPPPELTLLPVTEVAGLLNTDDGTSLAAAGSVAVAPDRLHSNVVGEMRDNGATVTFDVVASGVLEPGTAGIAVSTSEREVSAWLRIRSCLPGATVPDELAAHVSVPFLLTPGGVGVAMACRDTHLHGGHVVVDGDTLSFLLPVFS